MHFSAIYVSAVFVQAAVLQLITILHILLVNCNLICHISVPSLPEAPGFLHNCWCDKTKNPTQK